MRFGIDLTHGAALTAERVCMEGCESRVWGACRMRNAKGLFCRCRCSFWSVVYAGGAGCR